MQINCHRTIATDNIVVPKQQLVLLSTGNVSKVKKIIVPPKKKKVKNHGVTAFGSKFHSLFSFLFLTFFFVWGPGFLIPITKTCLKATKENSVLGLPRTKLQTLSMTVTLLGAKASKTPIYCIVIQIKKSVICYAPLLLTQCKGQDRRSIPPPLYYYWFLFSLFLVISISFGVSI